MQIRKVRKMQMTNEFAIKVLTELRGYGDKFANIGFDRKEALGLAIKALEQQQNIHDKCKRCVEFSEFEERPCEDWLSTFNTESATECFTAVQRLKESVNDRLDASYKG